MCTTLYTKKKMQWYFVLQYIRGMYCADTTAVCKYKYRHPSEARRRSHKTPPRVVRGPAGGGAGGNDFCAGWLRCPSKSGKKKSISIFAVIPNRGGGFHRQRQHWKTTGLFRLCTSSSSRHPLSCPVLYFVPVYLIIHIIYNLPHSSSRNMCS